MGADAIGESTVCAVVLAAGKGTRMKSDKAKVLHEVFGRAMVGHVIEAVRKAGIFDVIVVVGHQQQEVMDCLLSFEVRFAVQEEQLGTGHAVMCAASLVNEKHRHIFILCGDTPLISPATLKNMERHHLSAGSVLTVMTTSLTDPANYGRIITDQAGGIVRIVEEKDASESERRVNEINAGIYLADREFLFTALQQVGSDNSQGEVYLTDIVAVARRDGEKVERFSCLDASEVLGVNSRVELAQAERRLRRGFNDELMGSGVTMQDPETTYIGRDVIIGSDSIVCANVHIAGNSALGKRCVVHPFCYIKDCSLGDDVIVEPFSYLTGQSIAAGSTVAGIPSGRRDLNCC
jgi:bifunctional UDP-N-acetylglucosamine pyrophosphorylase/glucosamine-1-phosphate N-acetyltransferase